MGLADAHRPIHNLIISNVPGPPFPLYLAGAELVAAYPMGPIMDGAGLNITVMSYRNHIDIGFMADKDSVPDIWELAAAVQARVRRAQGAGRDQGPDAGQDAGAGHRDLETGTVGIEGRPSGARLRATTVSRGRSPSS